MKNNKGFGKFEVLTMIVVLLAIFAFLGYRFLSGTNLNKLNAMKKSASNLAKTVIINKESFYNPSKVFLGEAIDEQLFTEVKNPIGEGNCSRSESFVELTDSGNYVTFQCGEYLMDHVSVNDVNEATFYKVGEWSTTKTNDNDEEKVLYNCKENAGGYIFDEHYDESYFIYQINRMFSNSYSSVEAINRACPVEKITMYRTKEEVTK